MKRSLFCYVVIICISLPFAFSQTPDKYQSLLVNKELINGANAVVRYNFMSVSIEKQDKMIITQKRIVTVLNKNGNNYIHAYKHYDPKTKIKSIQALVYDSFGKEIKKIKKNDFRDVSAVPGGTLYSDSRVLYLDYTPVGYPYTIEFTSVVETSNTAFIYPWYFLDGYNVSTEESFYELTFNASDFSIRVNEKNFGQYNIVKKNENGYISYQGTNFKAIKSEDLSPSFRELTPNIMFTANKFHLEGVDGTADNWKELGEWQYHKLLAGRDEVSEKTKNEIIELVRNINDPVEKSKKVYEYVQNSTRYISVQVGIGGWMPIAAIEVDKVKYGDCKGLTNYTKALLKVAGVESYYCVVYADTDEKRSIDPEFASMQGNHIILNIPTDQKNIWLECTSQIHPFGFLGDFTDDRNVLVLKPEGGEIVKTEAYLNEDNYQLCTGEYSINENGDIKGGMEIKTKGIQYDNRFYLEKRTSEDNTKRYKEYLDNINNLHIEKFSFENNKSEIEFTEKVDLSASKYASATGNKLIFVVNAFNKKSHVPDRYRNRQLPFQINRGYLDEDEFTIHLPEGYGIEAFPANELVENKFGRYQIEFIKNEDKTITYKRKILIKEGQYPKEDYEAYRNFTLQVSRLDESKIVLVKKT